MINKIDIRNAVDYNKCKQVKKGQEKFMNM